MWIFAGRQISELVDRFRTAVPESKSIDLIAYQGSGDGGTLIIDGRHLTLAPLNPHVGSTKDDHLALSNAGNVFAFGPLRSQESELLVAEIPKTHDARLMARRSYVPWLSFDGSAKPQFNRRNYYQFTAKKSDGAKLEMIWSMTPAGDATNLIRIDISNASR